MSDSPLEQSSLTVTPQRCLSGAAIAGGLTLALYLLTSAIALSFAQHPSTSSNPAVINISIAVRTLVLGVSTLGTFVFGLVAVGLIFLALQILIQKKNKTDT